MNARGHKGDSPSPPAAGKPDSKMTLNKETSVVQQQNKVEQKVDQKSGAHTSHEVHMLRLL
jgi:hypothetical protein